jgi:hypothetical protein
MEWSVSQKAATVLDSAEGENQVDAGREEEAA